MNEISASYVTEKCQEALNSTKKIILELDQILTYAVLTKEERETLTKASNLIEKSTLPLNRFLHL